MFLLLMQTSGKATIQENAADVMVHFASIGVGRVASLPEPPAGLPRCSSVLLVEGQCRHCHQLGVRMTSRFGASWHNQHISIAHFLVLAGSKGLVCPRTQAWRVQAFHELAHVVDCGALRLSPNAVGIGVLEGVSRKRRMTGHTIANHLSILHGTSTVTLF